MSNTTDLKSAAQAQADKITSVIGNPSDILSANSQAQSGTEPKAGEQGKGTLNSPFDQGNVAGQSGTTGENKGDEPGAK